MIAIWPSSEKLELGFRWDLPACCAWGSFAASLTLRPVLRLVSCLTRILLVDEKNILIQNSLQSYSFATHDNQCRAVSTGWWELCIQIRAVTQEILPNIITNNLLYCNIAVRGQGSYFVRIRFSVNGELLVSCSWLFADNRYESRSWVSASTFDHDVITPNLSFLPQTSCWRSNLIFLLL